MDQELFKLIQIPYQFTDSTFLLDTDFILEQQDQLYLLKISTNQKFLLNYRIEFDKITGIAKYSENTYYLVEQFQNVAQIYRLIVGNSCAVIRVIYKTQMQRFCYQMNDLKDRRVQQHKTRIRPGYFKYQEVYVALHQNGLLHPMQNLVKSKGQESGFIDKYFISLKKDSLLIYKENQVLRLDQLAEEEENEMIQQIRLPTEQVTLRNGLLRIGKEFFLDGLRSVDDINLIIQMGITNDLFHELLAFEERYHQGCDKYDVIQKLIDLYAVLIEHYDSIQDPVGFYFNEKLQSLFACQRALKTIRKTNQDMAPFVIHNEVSSIQNSQESVKAKQQQQAASGEQKKKERQTKAKIAMEVQDQTALQQNNLQSIIEVYDQTIDKVQKTINEELKKQDDAFLQRRLKREKTNLQRKSSRLCSTKCSTERLDVFDSCIEFSNGSEQTQELSKFKLMNFLKEQSEKISSEETQTIEAVAVEEVQPFEEVQVEEYVETEVIVRPHRKQIRESESEDLLDSPPQVKKASYGIVDDGNGDMMLLEDESNLITELNVELQNEDLVSK